jgi:pentatricopeptide repeat protein
VLSHFYCSSGNMADARKTFVEMPEKDSVVEHGDCGLCQGGERGHSGADVHRDEVV